MKFGAKKTPTVLAGGHVSRQMGCPALGIWVGFLKQPALPGEAPTKKISSKKFLKNKNHY
jgi:hypothetical protein